MRSSLIFVGLFGAGLALAETNKQIDQYQNASRTYSNQVASEITSIDRLQESLLGECKDLMDAQTKYKENEAAWSNTVKADALKASSDSLEATLMGHINEAVEAMREFSTADAKADLDQCLPVAQRGSLLAIARCQAPLSGQLTTFTNRYNAYRGIVDNYFKNDTVVSNPVFKDRVSDMLVNLRAKLKAEILNTYYVELMKVALGVSSTTPVPPTGVVTQAMRDAATRRWNNIGAKHIEWNRALALYKNALAGLVALPDVPAAIAALCNFLYPPSSGSGTPNE